MQEGQRLVFREGRTKAVGNVTLVIPHNPVGAEKKGGQGGASATDRGGDKAIAKAARNEQRHKPAAAAPKADQPQAVAS